MTPATDVFAFGATLAYALTGDSPFGSGASSEVMLYRVVHEEPDLAEVPAPLAPLVRACLAKEPMDRPGAAHLHERLAELAARAGSGRGRGATLPAPAEAREEEAAGEAARRGRPDGRTAPRAGRPGAPGSPVHGGQPHGARPQGRFAQSAPPARPEQGAPVGRDSPAPPHAVRAARCRRAGRTASRRPPRCPGPTRRPPLHAR